MSQPTSFPGDPSAWTVETPPWPPVPGPAAPAPLPPAIPPRRKGPLVLAAVAILGVLAGAIGTAVLVTAAFLSAAEDIGRGMSEGLGTEIGRSVGEGLGQSVREPGPPQPQGAGGPVEQFPAVAPGTLGPDPVLDAYARSCFDGDLQACDDLWYESPPMSDYETYAGTCGGRVKQEAVAACTDLD
jgi:hypothetical protein